MVRLMEVAVLGVAVTACQEREKVTTTKDNVELYCPTPDTSSARIELFKHDDNVEPKMTILAKSRGRGPNWGNIPDLDHSRYEYNDVARSATLYGAPGTTVWLYNAKGYKTNEEVLEITVLPGTDRTVVPNLNRFEVGTRWIHRHRGGIQGKVSGVYWVVGRKPNCLPPPLAIDTAMRRFAPEVRLHPEDPHHPTSVPWYLERVRMRLHRPSLGPINPDIDFLRKGQVNVGTLIAQRHQEEESGGGIATSNFFLQISTDSDEQTTRRGNLDIAPAYVHFRPAPGGIGEWDIQYWFFYAYNGDFTPTQEENGEHDLEHTSKN